MTLPPKQKPERALRLLVGGLAITALFLAWAGLRPEPTAPDRPIAGVTLDARRHPDAGILTGIQSLAATHVAVIPYASVRGTEVRFNPEGRWFSESQGGIRQLADSLASLGIELIIKPQIWISRGGFAGHLDFASDDEWSEWESGYRDYAFHYADLAERVDADIFVIGSELTRSALERPDFWRGLISDVRTRFSGTLVYAANWYAEVDSVTFWDDLDLIGVQGYYPISTEPDPSPEALAQGWTLPSETLSNLASKWDRQILFTEIGYRSVSSAAAEPWAWAPRDSTESPDLNMQKRLFEAFFNGPWREPWVRGAVIWKWHGRGPGSDRRDVDFTPQGKPAEEIIRQAFQEAKQRIR